MTYKVGDKVRYPETGANRDWAGLEGEVIETQNTVGTYRVKVSKVPETLVGGWFVPSVGGECHFNPSNLELIEPEFGFKDIQVGDKVRRTETWDSGTVKSVEGVVVTLNSTQATTKEGLPVGHYRDEANKHLVLELLDRPEPKHWLEEKPVGAIGLFGQDRYKKVLKKTAEDAWEVTFIVTNRTYKLNSEQCRDQWPSLNHENDDKVEWIK